MWLTPRLCPVCWSRSMALKGTLDLSPLFDWLARYPRHRATASYSAVPVDGTATFTFFSRIRVAFPVRWRR
jgi:hypothetical protein